MMKKQIYQLLPELLVILLIVLFSRNTTLAQEKPDKKSPINIDLVQASTLPRSGAPIQFEWQMSWMKEGILEGQLEIELFDDFKNRSVFRYEMALTNEIKQFKTFHSSMLANDINQQISIYPKFIVKGKKYDLGEFSFRVGKHDVRNFMVGYCSNWRGSRRLEYQKQTEENIKFENFDPFSGDKKCFTSIDHLEPQNISVNPIHLCRYDMIIMDPYSLSVIRQSQWKSIIKWVSAGGSLWLRVSPDENSRQKDFLNQLLSHQDSTDEFTSNEKGRLIVSGKKTSWDINRDLGKIWIDYVVKEEKLGEWSEQGWRTRMVFLWKFRKLHANKILQNGIWKDFDLEKIVANQKEVIENLKKKEPERRRYDPYGRLISYNKEYWENFKDQQKEKSLSHHLRMQSPIWIGSVIKNLMPESLSVPPPYLLMLLAGTYFLIVGPGDYFILGMFKKRWITWISFPLVTVLVTLMLVQIAHSYMKTERDKNELVIYDVGKSGEIIKSSKIELVLASSFKQIKTDVKEGLFSSLKGSNLSHSDNQWAAPVGVNQYNTNQSNNSTLLNPNDLSFQGYFPVEYSVTQNVRQWTPELLCVTAIPSDLAGPEIDWSSIMDLIIKKEQNKHVAKDEDKQAINGKIKKLIQSKIGSDSGFMLLHGSETISSVPSKLTEISQLIKTMSMNTNTNNNLGGLLTRMSPSGAANLEDIAVIDQLDKDIHWLIVINPVETGIHVYRKQFSKITDK